MRALLALLFALAAGWPALAQTRPEVAPGALPGVPTLTAREIVQRAHAAAGGESWVRPRTLHMRGEAVYYRDGAVVRDDRYEMWRVYPEKKDAAHAADGKVRIESWRDGRRTLLLAFDGERSYTEAGPQPPSEADRQWSENFGFGVIRFALDEGFRQERLPDDLVDGRPAYVVRIIDPGGAKTQFAIAQNDYAILRVGFDTPRGWHERIYSDFFSKPGVSWVQPGRVRLFYDGVKQNEIFWKDFTLDGPMPPALFVVRAP